MLEKRIVGLSVVTSLFLLAQGFAPAQDKPAPERQPSGASTQPNQTQSVLSGSGTGPAPGLPDLRGPWHSRLLNTFFAITQSGENLTINWMEDGHWPPPAGHPPRPIFEGVIGKTGDLRGRGVFNGWQSDKPTWVYDSGFVSGSELRLISGLVLDRVELTPEAKGAGRDIDLNGSWQGQGKTSSLVITQSDLTTEGLWPDGSSFRGFTTTSRTVAITASLKTSAANAFGFIVPTTKESGKWMNTLNHRPRSYTNHGARLPGHSTTPRFNVYRASKNSKASGRGRPNGDSQPSTGDYDVSQSASKVTVRLLAAAEIDHTIYEGTFETIDSAAGRIRDGKSTDRYAPLDPGALDDSGTQDHLRLSSGMRLTRASASAALYAREAHGLSLVPLPVRPFDLNGNWSLPRALNGNPELGDQWITMTIHQQNGEVNMALGGGGDASIPRHLQ